MISLLSTSKRSWSLASFPPLRPVLLLDWVDSKDFLAPLAQFSLIRSSTKALESCHSSGVADVKTVQSHALWSKP